MNIGFQPPARVDNETALRNLDLRKYVNFIWRQWTFIGAVTALALIIALIYLARATPLYTATAQVLLDPRREKAATGTDNILDDIRLESIAAIESQLAIIKSDSLLRRVVVKERLANLTRIAAAETDSEEDAKTKENQLIQDAIGKLRGALMVKRSGQAYVLDIAITWEDPVRAAQLANALADAYVTDQLDARLEAAKRASSWLSDRLIELRQQLRDSEEAATKFRNDHGLARSGPTVALNDQQLSELNSKLIAARTDAAEKKTRVDFLVDVAAGKKSLDALPDSFQSQSSVMGALRAKLVDASQREADLLSRYNSRHPAVVNLEAEKRDIERSIAAETQRLAQTVRSEYALARARLDATEQAMREATGQGGLDNEDAVRLRELERTAAVNKSLFEDLLQKAKVTQEQSTFRTRDARIITPAQAPGGRSFPRTSIVLIIALVAGIGVGTGAAAAREMLNVGFTTASEVEEVLGVPVLASILRMEPSKLKKDGAEISIPYYQIHYPLSPFSEAMRTLRSGIHMSDVDCPPKVIHVTSSRPSEGKSVVALSLAISAMSSGLKVALVDADLRHPSASRFFKLERSKGLVDLLTSAGKPDAATMFQRENLMIIPAGSKSLNPPDILGSERMKALIAHLRQNFDFVVVDTPPVGPVIDPTIVARLADTTIFVIQWASTPRELVERSLQQVSNVKRVGGVVLNLVSQGHAKKYGGEHYYASYYNKYYSE
jgi:capsular exopolysaccharide synthesis family protein